MRRVIVLTLLSACCAMAQAQVGVSAAGSRAPNALLHDLAGKALQLSSACSDQVTVLCFGRLSWRPCRGVAAELQRLQQQYRDDRVAFYWIEVGGTVKATAAAGAGMNLTLPVLLDGDCKVAAEYDVMALPHVFLIDASGIVRISHIGYQPELPAMLAGLIEQYRPQPRPKLPRLVEIEGLGCVACKTMPPLLRELQEELQGKVTIEIMDFNPDLVDRYRLEVMPTQIFFNGDGDEVSRHTGLMSKDEMLDRFKKMGVAVE
ncbi:MAG: redoxin domain-containing protein [Armatimonadia bacterium]